MLLAHHIGPFLLFCKTVKELVKNFIKFLDIF
nr:MAG TPA: hypothetical protein [Caudoviricetes sp.]DAV39547.1 MAG TPA: hypothetical protein [Caudoviricetes sp.]